MDRRPYGQHRRRPDRPLTRATASADGRCLAQASAPVLPELFDRLYRKEWKAAGRNEEGLP